MLGLSIRGGEIVPAVDGMLLLRFGLFAGRDVRHWEGGALLHSFFLLLVPAVFADADCVAAGYRGGAMGMELDGADKF